MLTSHTSVRLVSGSACSYICLTAFIAFVANYSALIILSSTFRTHDLTPRSADLRVPLRREMLDTIPAGTHSPEHAGCIHVLTFGMDDKLGEKLLSMMEKVLDLQVTHALGSFTCSPCTCGRHQPNVDDIKTGLGKRTRRHHAVEQRWMVMWKSGNSAHTHIVTTATSETARASSDKSHFS